MFGYDDHEGMYREMYYCLNNILLLVLDALEEDAQDGDPHAQEFISHASLEAYKSIFDDFGQEREILPGQLPRKKAQSHS